MTELSPQFHLTPEAKAGALQSNGTGRTNVVREKEQEWHQHAMRYRAAGMTEAEIADACGVSPAAVGALCNTPWFEERVLRLMCEMDRDVMEVFKRASLKAAFKLVELSNGAKSEAIQLAATQSILDRHLGKPVVSVVQETTIRSDDPVAEAAALRREISSLDQRN